MQRAIYVAMLATALVALAACGRAEFAVPVAAASVKQALLDAGVNVCVEEPLGWDAVAGYVEGSYYELDADCAARSPTHPGVRLWIAEFDRVEARDAALLTFERGRRHLGSGRVWSYGPLLIAIDGQHDADLAATVRHVIATSGAQ